MREYKKSFVYFGVPQAKCIWKVRAGRSRLNYDQQSELNKMYIVELQKQMENDKSIAGPVSIFATYYFPVEAFSHCSFGDGMYIKPNLILLDKFLFDLLLPVGLLSSTEQICQASSIKLYGHNPRTEFTIEALPWRTVKKRDA